MKKLALVSGAIVLALVAGFYTSKNPDDSIGESLQRLLPKKKKKASVSVKLVEANPEVLIESKKTVEASKISKKVADLLSCLQDKTCLNKHERFNDESLDPHFQKLVDKLEILEIQNNLDQISEDQLLKMAAFKNPALFHKSAALLLERNLLSLKDLAKIDFQGKEVKLFLSLYRSGQLELNPELKALRNERIKNYLNQDNYTLLTTLKEMQNLSFESSEAQMLSGQACRKIKQIDSFQGIYRKQINKLAQKYRFNPDC